VKNGAAVTWRTQQKNSPNELTKVCGLRYASAIRHSAVSLNAIKISD